MIDAIIVIMGIFVICALSIVVYIQNKYEIPPGYWPVISAASATMILAETAGLLGNSDLHLFLILVTMVLLFIMALFKYWETLRMIEKPDIK